MNIEARRTRSNRGLVPCILVLGLLATGGIFYWRRGLNEADLLATGRSGVTRALRKQGVAKADLVVAVPVSRRVRKDGDLDLNYNLTIDRAWGRGLNQPDPGYTGQIDIPMTVTVEQVSTPDSLGFSRPMWSVKRAAIVYRPEATDEIWARLPDNPRNAIFDARLFISPVTCNFRMIAFASAIHLEQYDAVLAYLGSPKDLSPLTWADNWNPKWARRLKGELGRIDEVVKSGRLEPKLATKLRKGLDDFANNPANAEFQAEYQRLLKAKN